MEITQIKVKTSKREEIIDITEKVQHIIRKSKFSEGIVRVFVPHTTAGITINENADPAVKVDFLHILKKLIPQSREYKHLEGNSDSHVKASLTGFSQAIIVQEGNMILGTWQGLMFCEYDGPRTRKVIIALESA